jgi:hypothetical protein
MSAEVIVLAENGNPHNKFVLPPSATVNNEVEKMYADEKGMKILLERLRKYYYKKGLVGSVEISRSYLGVESSLSIDIDGTGEYEDEEICEKKSVKMSKMVDKVVEKFLQFIVKGTTTALEQLMNRAKVYAGKSYAADMSLSLSASWSDPQGILGVTISCSASVSSILDCIYKEHKFEMDFCFNPVDSDCH